MGAILEERSNWLQDSQIVHLGHGDMGGILSPCKLSCFTPSPFSESPLAVPVPLQIFLLWVAQDFLQGLPNLHKGCVQLGVRMTAVEAAEGPGDSLPLCAGKHHSPAPNPLFREESLDAFEDPTEEDIIREHIRRLVVGLVSENLPAPSRRARPPQPASHSPGQHQRSCQPGQSQLPLQSSHSHPSLWGRS